MRLWRRFILGDGYIQESMNTSPLNEEQIFKKITGILKEEIKLKAEFSKETALLKEGLLDSLDFLKYLTLIEESFQMKIDDEEIERYQLGIIAAMISFIKSKH